MVTPCCCWDGTGVEDCLEGEPGAFPVKFGDNARAGPEEAADDGRVGCLANPGMVMPLKAGRGPANNDTSIRNASDCTTEALRTPRHRGILAVLSLSDHAADCVELLLREEPGILVVGSRPDLSQCLANSAPCQLPAHNAIAGHADLRGELSRIEEGDGLVSREHAQLLAVCTVKQKVKGFALLCAQLDAWRASVRTHDAGLRRRRGNAMKLSAN